MSRKGWIVVAVLALIGGVVAFWPEKPKDPVNEAFLRGDLEYLIAVARSPDQPYQTRRGAASWAMTVARNQDRWPEIEPIIVGLRDAATTPEERRGFADILSHGNGGESRRWRQALLGEFLLKISPRYDPNVKPREGKGHKVDYVLFIVGNESTQERELPERIIRERDGPQFAVTLERMRHEFRRGRVRPQDESCYPSKFSHLSPFCGLSAAEIRDRFAAIRRLGVVYWYSVTVGTYLNCRGTGSNAALRPMAYLYVYDLETQEIEFTTLLRGGDPPERIEWQSDKPSCMASGEGPSLDGYFIVGD